VIAAVAQRRRVRDPEPPADLAVRHARGEGGLDRLPLGVMAAPLNTTTKTSDGKTYVAYLDTLRQVNKDTKIGVVGYCMGGPYTLFTAAAVPERVGAGVAARRQSCHRQA
jgi:dienelactone hydrolase